MKRNDYSVPNCWRVDHNSRKPTVLLSHLEFASRDDEPWLSWIIVQGAEERRNNATDRNPDHYSKLNKPLLSPTLVPSR